MRPVDRGLSWLLLIGAVLHRYGSFTGYADQPETLTWSLSGVLAAALTAALNLLRADRPDDRPLALIAFAASVAWVTVAFGFGAAIGSLADIRVLWHALTALGLAMFSARQAFGMSSSEPVER